MFLYFMKRSYCNGSHGSNINGWNKSDLIDLVSQLESEMNSNMKELT